MKKILLAGIVGGLVVFVWGFVAHMLLPVGTMGISQMPVNSPLLEAMKQNLAVEGLYAFPGEEVGRKQTEAEDAVWIGRYKMGPRGLLLYHPTGTDPVSPQRLVLELATDVSAALVLAWLLTALGGSIGSQVRFAVIAGVFGWISINVAYWNWYGFPCAFILGELIDQVVGWGLAGLAMALLWRGLEKRALRRGERVWET